ncbi:short chain dehydrogenase/reductase [Apiospora hydei]|uniref:Short chain dehydrogenase/reductase n=1 Tax=Apiospora hydei TaxID=1337664 RepID=A0ABR1WMH8_9PEZI
MHQLEQSPDILTGLSGQTIIITGAARGIGAAAATIFNKHGANVAIADLPQLQDTAETLIRSLDHPERATFVATNVTKWREMVELFDCTSSKFGRVDMVVANAGIMENVPIFDMQLDENGAPLESKEALDVLDVNLKGALNTLRLGLHYIGKNPMSSEDGEGHRGSITLVASTSGYFGMTGNAAYVASKHGVIGLLRASQQKAMAFGIRVNAVAPFMTPTQITSGFDQSSLLESGLEINTPDQVGRAIAHATVDETRRGTACLVSILALKYIKRRSLT